MIDWSREMEQTFEYYEVDKGTWGNVRLIDTMKSATIVRDRNEETLGHATFECGEALGEVYVRTYLVATQDGRTERECLGTHMVQTPSTSFDGRVENISLDAYTPLLELKDDMPPVGYFVASGANVVSKVVSICEQKCHAPIVGADSGYELDDTFVANTSDTWLSFCKALLEKASMEFTVDPFGRIVISPVRNSSSMAPSFTFDDGNSSILYPDIKHDTDLYGIPNVVSVVYSKSSSSMVATAVNDYQSSETSTVNRGRNVVFRDTSPDVSDNPTQEELNAYAERILFEKSSTEHKLTYKHGYCGVRDGDAVRLNYSRAGIDEVARVDSQTIECSTSCSVDEVAKYSKNMWRQLWTTA